MPGDYSKFSDDPLKRYSRVLMQQGRVTTDADENERQEIGIRRDRTMALDIVGKAAVPRATTPNAFEITASGDDLKIGAGRMYVDGIIAEAVPSDPLTYKTQPFFPDPPPIGSFGAGRGLAYLEVWEREITVAEDPNLPEVALLGLDTTTRTKTIWQVKIAKGLTCTSDLTKEFPPSPALLTVQVDTPGEDPDPCKLQEPGGFRDVENRHYRVEIHGNASPAKIKFARDPIVSTVEQIKPGLQAGQTILKVTHIGRDSILRFQPGDVVELMNERRLYRDEPGILALVAKIDEAAREITVNRTIAAGEQGPKLPAWLIRWDQHDANPNDPNADHLITDTGAFIPLENGISIKLEGGTPHHGDFWYTAARAATHTAELLDKAPPRGVIRHRTPLATISDLAATVLEVESDCRTFWPPDCDCECQVCVNPVDHKSGRGTIQAAIDKVRVNGGGKVCLKPGVYFINQPLVIQGGGIAVSHIRLTGHGDCIVIYTGSAAAAVVVQEIDNIVIEEIEFHRSPEPSTQDVAAIVIRGCTDVAVQHCAVSITQTQKKTIKDIGIALDLYASNVRIVGCRITASIAVSTLPASSTLLHDVEVLGNTMTCSEAGVRLLGIGVSVAVRENEISAPTSCIRVEGITIPGLHNIIDANRCDAGRGGIGTDSDDTTISNNIVRGKFVFAPNSDALTPADQTFSAIALYKQSLADTLVRCLVVGNRCSNSRGMGVLIAFRADKLLIKQNLIEQTAGPGIGMLDKASESKVTIENNDLRQVGLGNDGNRSYGIRLAPQFEGVVAANTIDGVGVKFDDNRPKRQPLQSAGIRADAPRIVKIHENRIRDVAASLQQVVAQVLISPQPPQGSLVTSLASAAIDVVPPVGVVEITNNIVHVEGQTIAIAGVAAVAHCLAIRLAPERVPGTGTFHFNQLNFDWTDFGLLTDLKNPALDTGSRFTACWIYFNGGSTNWVTLAPATSLVLVRANELEIQGVADTSIGLVEIGDTALRITFGGNICANRTRNQQRLQHGVQLRGETLVVDSNQVLGNFELALDLFSTAAQTAPLATVLGNITQGQINLNNVALGNPWAPLNVRVP